MSILSPLTGFVRSTLGVAEREGTQAVAHSPLHETVALEEKLEHLAHALQTAAESADRQVATLDGLAQSLPALIEQVSVLTAQVTAMNDQAVGLNRRLEEVTTLLAPLDSAERDVSRLQRVFRRRRRRDGGG